MTDQARKAAAKFERILVVDPNLASAKMLANMIRDLWPWAKIYGAKDAARAMELAADVDPQLVFVEAAGPNLDGMAFTRAYRRCDHDCREAPIIMIFADASGAQILAARDVGVHEFLRRPITMGDLQKRLEAVTGRPRDWIEAVGYVGPDRRRFNLADFKGPKKRRTDGPAKLQKMLDHGDPLLAVESISKTETRTFIKNVLANYWIYRARLGGDTSSLTELAEGRWPLYRWDAADASN